MFDSTLILSIIFISLGIFIFKRWEIWVLYFIFGGVGVSILAVYIFQISGIDIPYRALLTKVVYFLMFTPEWLKAFPESGMFLFQKDRDWVAFQMDIECLGFIEIMVFLGLLIFYPAIRRIDKIKYVFLGATSIYIINILRIVLIILIVKFFGLTSTFLSHTVIGRLFFFFLVIGVYWHVFTVETIKQFKELGEKNV